jgi:hypothetical protein
MISQESKSWVWPSVVMQMLPFCSNLLYQALMDTRLGGSM